nr:hypothetical protein [Tanacetum cinerariifolium]
IFGLELAFRDTGQGLDLHSLQGRRSFFTFGITGSSLSILDRSMAVYVSTSPHTVKDVIKTHNPVEDDIGCYFLPRVRAYSYWK